MKNCPYCNASPNTVMSSVPLVELVEVREMGTWMRAVKCNQCLAKGPAFQREDQAVAAWDSATRRSDSEPLAASHARLVKALSNVSEWILNWEPNFTDDPEWRDRDQIEFEQALAEAKTLTGEES